MTHSWYSEKQDNNVSIPSASLWPKWDEMNNMHICWWQHIYHTYYLLIITCRLWTSWYIPDIQRNGCGPYIMRYQAILCHATLSTNCRRYNYKTDFPQFTDEEKWWGETWPFEWELFYILHSWSANKGGPDRESRTEGRLVSPCGDPLKFFLEITWYLPKFGRVSPSVKRDPFLEGQFRLSG